MNSTLLRSIRKAIFARWLKEVARAATCSNIKIELVPAASHLDSQTGMFHVELRKYEQNGIERVHLSYTVSGSVGVSSKVTSNETLVVADVAWPAKQTPLRQ